MSDQRTRIVWLTDDELALLDGHPLTDKAQAEVTAALARIAARSDDLTHRQTDLIASMMLRVAEDGTLRWTRKPIDHCDICGKTGTYAPFKSGPRAGEPNRKRPIRLQGVDMDPSFVTINGIARLGGCADCMNELLPHLRAALAGVPVDAPAALLGDDAPAWTKHRNRRCKGCGWTGHEGEMKQERTLLGDGWFPSRCPDCNAGGAFDRTVDRIDGFVIVPA